MASPSEPALPPAPNPLTPLAWLPPDIAYQYEIQRHLTAYVVGAWLWDVLNSLSDDVHMFRRHKTRPTDIAYVLSRLLTCGFIMSTFIFIIAPLNDCQAAIQAVSWFAAFACPCNSFLIFVRARGVFYRNKIIAWGFFALWLTTFASLTTPFSYDAVHLGPTKACINDVVKRFSAASFVAIAAFDTTVFIAISLKVSSYGMTEGWKGRLKSIFTGKGVGYVSKALLQTGQLYYMATVGLNLIAMVLLLTPSLSLVYQGMFTVPNVALQNAMACRVYRLLKLGIIQENPHAPIHSNSGNQPSAVQFPATRSAINDTVQDPDDIGLASFTKRYTQGPIRINISEETTTDAKDRDSVAFAGV
ncbi:unnamed protein product [Somion occarium]|uniref:Uncharacterized protein n=1 Tax=Somion occarium TaxID=3059160 RepID=A0ABP1DSI0_9APHY